MQLDELNGPWEIRLKIVHLCATFAHIYRLARRLVNSGEFFIQVYHWEIHNPPPTVPDFGQVFPILGPLFPFDILGEQP